MYGKGLYFHAGVQYLVSAYLGYEPGIINAAILSEKYRVFDEGKDFDMADFGGNAKIWREDKVLKGLEEKGVVKLDGKSQKEFFFEDLWSYCKKVVRSESQKNILNHILFYEPLNYPKNNVKKIRKENVKKSEETTKKTDNLHPKSTLKDFNLFLSKKLYLEGLIDHNTFSGLRLGDLYFYGKLSDNNLPDYHTAIHYYEKAINTNTSRDTIAQSYQSLGYMHQFGLGVDRNSTLAIQYYQDVKKFLFFSF